MKTKKAHLFETHFHVSSGQAAHKNEDALKRKSEMNLPWPIEMLSPHSLHATERNARTHSKKQIQQIAESISRFGMMAPIVADDRRRIVAGHARVEAAKLVGLRQVPVIKVLHLGEVETRAFMLADNKIAANAGWNRETLAIELEELQVALPEIGLDVGITGFEPGEIDTIMLDFANDHANPADQIPDLEASAVAQTSDLFVLGRHRLQVGDARNPRIYAQLLQGEPAAMTFLDPPYNVKIDGHVGSSKNFDCDTFLI